MAKILRTRKILTTRITEVTTSGANLCEADRGGISCQGFILIFKTYLRFKLFFWKENQNIY